MATTTVSKTDLIGVQSIAFIRPITLKLDVNGARPNTVLHVFFDNQLVDDISFPFGSQPGTPCITDANGVASIRVAVPGGRFSTGAKTIVVSDTAQLSQLSIPGSTFGSATQTFSSIGVDKIFQTTITTTTINYETVYLVDPLAQSFFTYGKTGGVFVTSVELYFETKDSSIPVRVELREMINGYPAPLRTGIPELVCSKNAGDVLVSNNGSVSTKFTFANPVYLKENADYCFAVISSSNQYNLFTSKLGEVSLENGRTIFDQPFVGSMFKSENNVTWTAEQSEDIKFKLNIANFDISSDAQLVFDIVNPQLATSGTNFTTTSGSSLIQFHQEFQHGLSIGDLFSVSADTLGTFNGIAGTQLSGAFNVTSIVNPYTFVFDCLVNATSSGTIASGQYVKQVNITKGGSGYSSTTPPIVNFVSSSGINATGTAVVVNGSVVSVTMTNGGSGYLANPTVSFVSSVGGSGASGAAITDAMFTINTNKYINDVTTSVLTSSVPGTNIYGTLDTTVGNYFGGGLTNYSSGKQYNIVPNATTKLETNGLLASRFNENAAMSNNPSMKTTWNLTSNNSNVSPVIDINRIPNVYAYSNSINNQQDETISATIATGVINSFIVTNGGSGYSLPPIVNVVGDGSGVIATAVLGTGGSSGQVISITFSNGGSGFSYVPTVVLTRASGDTTGSGATAYPTLTPFNSEISPNNGNALSRYLTDRILLSTVSTGITLFSNIYSESESNVDWYIRTSLSGSGVNHLNNTWSLLSCATDRNLSTAQNQFLNYEFSLNNIPSFDTYDLKMVMRSSNPAKVPVVSQYRVIIVA